MDIPYPLREALEQQYAGMGQAQMKQASQQISLRYRTQSGKGERLLTRDDEAIVYANARMPATYSAVFTALEQALTATDLQIETLLDVGAGTGAASWAANSLLDLKKITCVERESAMVRMGRTLMAYGSDVLREANWYSGDLTYEAIPCRADIVIASYVLNEMTEQGRFDVLHKLWGAAEKMLLIVEPGTPIAYAQMMALREQLIQWGAHIAAPCPHKGVCDKVVGDWCHFSCRVSRSKLHRQLKGGDAPYEDEKFIYLALVRDSCHFSGERVLRHPQIRGGHILLEVCSPEGIKSIKVTKKDGEKFKVARKTDVGDWLPR